MLISRWRQEEWIRVALGMFAVAFGANQFAPMVVTYQLHAGMTAVQTTFLFGIYAAGIMVALFIGGPLSDSHGRRALMRPALLCTAAGSLTLLLGHAGNFAALVIGRLIIGIAVGFVMSSGAAWIKELSPTIPIAARRSSVALTAGFSLAPLFAGLVAQWAPHPTLLPYAVHIVLALSTILLVWNVPARPGTGARSPFLPRSILRWRYLPIALAAPWAFGSVTTAFAFLPSVVGHGFPYPIALTGVMAFATMGVGTFVQRWTVNWRLRTGMVWAGIGMLASWGAVTVEGHGWHASALALLPLCAIVMGIAYGTIMVRGLAQTQSMAASSEMGAASGVFYALTYLGFFAPFLLSVIGPIVGLSCTFIFGLCVAAFTAFIITIFASTQRG